MNSESFDAASEPSLETGGKKSGRSGRRFLGVQFDCCRTYSRIYINHDQSAFVGHCPRCGKQVRVGISPDGMDAKFFSAG